MKYKPITGIMLTLLLMGILTLAFDIQPAKAESRTWTVDDDGPADFQTIHDAIDAASPGDTIFVKSGEYCEGQSAHITKPLTLQGENPETTIIDGSVRILASNTSLSGFTIISGYGWELGPILGSAYNCTLTNNILFGAGSIIYDNNFPNVIIGGSGWTISGNTIMDYVDAPWTVGGLWIVGQENTVICNTLGNETFLGRLWVWGKDNVIYHNNLYLYWLSTEFSEHNMWDHGYPSGGNYWDDYSGGDMFSGPYQNKTGGDGIGDTSYVIDENNQDNYPLMTPWTHENSIRDLIRDIDNMNLQQGIDNSLDAKLTAALGALEALNADKRNDAINKLYALIIEVEAQRGKKLTNEQADYLITATQEIIDLI